MIDSINPTGFNGNKGQPGSMAAMNPFSESLIASCGMDCAICMAYLRERNRCGGCYAPDRKCNRNCTISACGQVTDRYHHDCAEFPCQRLKQLDDRYRKKYHMSMLANLAAIQGDGIHAFVKSEQERWTCRACGGIVNVHRGRCTSCGKEHEFLQGE
jgi:hypothetical protein